MEPLEIKDTQHMSHFISEFYKSNVDYMQQRDMPAGEEEESRGNEVMEEVQAATDNQVSGVKL
jgi:hypothetical protein